MKRKSGRETAAERKLRKYFEKKKFPYQQHQYIAGMEVDYLLPGKVVVEIDGYVHLKPEKIRIDQNKNKKLATLGYKVIRLKNMDVLSDVKACFRKINLVV